MARKRITRFDIVTGLTAVFSTAWVVAFVARLLNPGLPPFSALDANILIVLGYWFVMKRNGNKEESR